ncbi:MLO-like protein 4 [Acorus gramineus]|uniref:MLO-like protein 4 n=1 Tax=Acorus gramineus TaxID=55184 RepID=A0AAV9AT88_ACOGR|nr:MLO-like protein 4 [Acorus gramineus]
MAVEEGRSLAETPTWSVATVTTFMVAVCFVVERSIHRFGKWLQRTKKKALFASLEKIREELMLLGIVSLMLGQTARWVSEICVPSSLFTSRFYICSEDDYGSADGDEGWANDTVSENARRLFNILPHNCGEGYEPFVSYQGLEQLNRFLFLLGITHVSYSCATVVLAMIKVYGWRKWENQTPQQPSGDLQARRNATMRRQSTFVFHHTSHPWSKNKILIWMLCFVHQFKGSIAKSDYLTIRLGFITNHKLPPSYDFHKYIVRSMEDEFHGIVGISWPLWGYAIFCIFINIHGLNMYFWLSFIPVIITMLVGTKLQHVVAQLALEIVETTDPLVGTQLNPRDSLFWFRRPEILLWLIHFISFQWGLNMRSCLLKNHLLIAIRLISGWDPNLRKL